MTFKRIIPNLLVDRDGRLAEAVALQSRSRVNDASAVVAAYAAAGADELLLTVSVSSPTARVRAVDDLSKPTAVPLSLEAEVHRPTEFARLLELGVSRISLEVAALGDPDLLARLAREFGTARLGVSITARRDQDVWRVSEGLQGQPSEWDPVTWARVAEAQGAGELIVRTPEAGPHGEPFDLDLLGEMTAAVHTPVVAAIGSAEATDIFDAMMIGGADAVAISSTLLSAQVTLPAIKAYLIEHGLPVRLS